jgi:hypothetical protein
MFYGTRAVGVTQKWITCEVAHMSSIAERSGGGSIVDIIVAK